MSNPAFTDESETIATSQTPAKPLVPDLRPIPRAVTNTVENEPIPPRMSVGAFICWDLARRFIATNPNWTRLVLAIAGGMTLVLLVLRGEQLEAGLVRALMSAIF